MRTKRLASAALLAAVAIGCTVTQITDVKTPRASFNGTLVDTTGNGSCITTYETVTSTGASVGSVQGQPNEDHDVSIRVTSVPANCAADQSFSWSSGNPQVATASKIGPKTGRIHLVSAGSTQACATGEQNASIVICIPVTVTNVAATPVTITPSGSLNIFPTACPSAGPTSVVLTANMSVTWSSSSSAVASVNPTSGNQTTVTGNAAGTVTITATGPQGQVGTVTVTVSQCPTQNPTAVFNFSVPSMCFSTLAGSAASQNFTLTVSNVTNPVVNVTSSNTSVATVVGVGSTTGAQTTWTVTRVGLGTANLTATVQGTNGSGSLPVEVRSTACPGGADVISFTPTSGSGRVNTTMTLSVNVCTVSGVVCNPFWTSDHPELVDVVGTGVTPINGFNFRTGFTATVTFIALGSAQICVQPSVTVVTPRFCSTAGAFTTIP